MSINYGFSKIFFAAGFSLLLLSGCARPVPINDFQTDAAAAMSAADAVGYLNSVRLTAFEGQDDLCSFEKKKVTYVGRSENDPPYWSSYSHLKITQLNSWRNIGRSGLWLHGEINNHVAGFFNVPGCQVLGKTATQEQITRSAQALAALGASYDQPAQNIKYGFY